MNIQAIKTRLIHAGECSLETVLTESIDQLKEGSIVVISAKVIALCQNRVSDKESITKRELIKQEAEWYTEEGFNTYGSSFAIINNTLIGSAGIDESNADGQYVLWPNEPQTVANEIRAFLRKYYAVKDVGVIITDSTSMPPLRRGTIGIMLAHSGFKAIRSHNGEKDLFGKPFQATVSGIGSSLAAAANVTMGEASQQTPLAVITDIPFVEFNEDNPTNEELHDVYLSLEDDLYAPFFSTAPWRRGGKLSH